MHRNDAAFDASANDDVTARLADYFEPEFLRRLERLCARDSRQLRHAPQW